MASIELSAALLRSAQQHGRTLIVSYPVGAPDDSRIAAGWRQDWEVDQWRAVLVAAGWQVTAQASLGDEVLYRCEAATG